MSAENATSCKLHKTILAPIVLTVLQQHISQHADTACWQLPSCTFAGGVCAVEPVPKAANALYALSKGLSPGITMLLRSGPACT